MLDRIRRRLTFANVMSTLAVFIALGGSSYALTVNGSQLKNRSVPGKALKRNTLTSREIRESSLTRVPRARNADRVGGVRAAQLRIRCLSGTFPIADVCVESTPRRAASYGVAVIECGDTGRPAGPGRRLPTHGELRAALGSVQLAAGGELTSEVYPSAATPGGLDVLYVTDQVGSVALTPNTGAGARSFRCVVDPGN